MPLLSLSSLILAAGLAAADEIAPTPATPPVFSVHDQDRDGYLDRAEFAALQAACAQRRGYRCATALKTFEVLDADRDGRIGEDELLSALGRRQRGGRAY